MLDKTFDHKKIEEKIYKMWEEGGYFKAERDPEKKPFTIVLPLPNASGKMHTGNVLMIAIEDLLIRWKRMQGYSALWIPGTDHAGFETQITFERYLKEEGKSRFDFDRETLYKKIWDFVHENKHLIDKQIRNMGASVDWGRYMFSLDDKSVDTVYNTFKKMHDDGLIYKDDYMVNYCPTCGTTFADLEIKHIEREDPLIYVKYRLIEPKENDPEFITVATTRPEPIFVDTHIAVNPKDKSKSYLIGRKVENPLTGKEMEIIADDFVDIEFGTGIVKLTPAHDKVDYEVAKRHNIPVIQCIDFNGNMMNVAREVAGLSAKNAREKVIEILKEKGQIEKIDTKYKHSISVCYKGSHDIEPMILPNWFVKVDAPHNSLKKRAHQAVKDKKVKIYPKWQEIKYHRWMEEMHDWAISRQVVWGIRIPVWYNVEENPNLLITFLNNKKEIAVGKISELLKTYPFNEIASGLQTLLAPKDATYVIQTTSPQGKYLQETDTFDTWFSSGQWPLITLGYPDSDDFKYFYPTDVLETAWEILRAWVSRMIMFGLYLTNDIPFKDVYLHGIVRALDGKKMSKSLGNVINPEVYQEEFGTDALRMGLISGTANGKDFNFPHDKVIAYRNFANKIWNITRFMMMNIENYEKEINKKFMPTNPDTLIEKLNADDKKILFDLKQIILAVDKNLAKYRFSDAGDIVYHFMWDRLASEYIEQIKNRADKDVALNVLYYVFAQCLKLLHPFMPFVTEEIWQNIPHKTPEFKPLIVAKWPTP